MYVKNVSLHCFRNYSGLFLNLQNGINVFEGKNAQGKTNFLEAVNVLLSARSFRTTRDEEMIASSSAWAKVSGKVCSDDIDNDVEIILKRGAGKSMQVNGSPVKKTAELYGRFSCVSFIPDEIRLIGESPSFRRRFFDGEISKLSHSFFEDAKAYAEALKNKNVILKTFKNRQKAYELVDVYNKQLCSYAKRIIAARAYFCELLNARATAIHEQICGKKEQLLIDYKKCVSDIKNADVELYEKMKRSFTEECAAGVCCLGPHREDFEFLVDGKPSVAFASQGQKRSVILSLKIGMMKIISEKKKQPCILLLDDVLSELDSQRSEALVHAVSSYQTLITAVSFDITGKNVIFKHLVNNGAIEKIL